MFNTDDAFGEFVLQARLRYLAFKRTVWLVETLFLLCILMALHSWGSNPVLLAAAFIIQIARVFAAAINHNELSVRFNVADAVVVA